MLLFLLNLSARILQVPIRFVLQNRIFPEVCNTKIQKQILLQCISAIKWQAQHCFQTIADNSLKQNEVKRFTRMVLTTGIWTLQKHNIV